MESPETPLSSPGTTPPHTPPSAVLGTMESHPSPLSTPLLAGAKWARLPPVQLSFEWRPTQSPSLFQVQSGCLDQRFSSGRSSAIALTWRSPIWTWIYWPNSVAAPSGHTFPLFLSYFLSCPLKSLLCIAAGGIFWKWASDHASAKALTTRGMNIF